MTEDAAPLLVATPRVNALLSLPSALKKSLRERVTWTEGYLAYIKAQGLLTRTDVRVTFQLGEAALVSGGVRIRCESDVVKCSMVRGPDDERCCRYESVM